MNKTGFRIALIALSLVTQTKATVIKSGTYYPIKVLEIKASETCSKDAVTKVMSSFGNLKKRFKRGKDSKAAFEAIINKLSANDMCQILAIHELPSPQSAIDTAPDALIVAMKIPSAKHRSVNPIPVIFTSSTQSEIILKTRKAAKLKKSFLKTARDSGLKAVSISGNREIEVS